MTKLAPAKDWRNRPIETWTVTTFTEYLRDKHVELFKVPYAPFRSWGLEQGILGTLIGTQSRTNPKPRTASNESVKKFIDVTFETYTPNKSYPGTSFGFMWTYRKNEWQRIIMEENKVEEKKEVQAEANKGHEEKEIKKLNDWW